VFSEDEHRMLWALYARHFPDDVPAEVAERLAGGEGAFAGAGGMPALSKAQFDALQAGVLQSWDGSQVECVQINTFLLAHPDADFTAAAGGPGPTGYTSGDIAVVKSAFADTKILNDVRLGNATQGSLKNFNAFTGQLVDLVH
jgi:hypothetical protein